MPERITEDISTVIWDLDGTLLDSMGVLEDGLAVVLPKHGLHLPSHEVIVQNYHGSLEDSINASLGGVDANRLTNIVVDFLEVQDAYYEMVDSHLFLDAVDFAKRAQEAGKNQLIVTNRAHEGRLRASPRSIVEHSILKGYIDLVICGDDSEHRKPNPEVLGGFTSSIDHKKLLVVGDQFVDAEFAQNLGARAILVNRDGDIPHFDRLGENWFDFVRVVKSLDEVAF